MKVCRLCRRKYIWILGILILIVTPFLYCYLNYQFWNHLDTSQFDSLREFRSDNIRGLKGRQILVHEDYVIIMSAIEEYAKINEIFLIVTSSYRIPKNNVNGTIVDPVKNSNHYAGHAIDFNISIPSVNHTFPFN